MGGEACVEVVNRPDQRLNLTSLALLSMQDIQPDRSPAWAWLACAAPPCTGAETYHGAIS